jgi:hypothetical protein
MFFNAEGRLGQKRHCSPRLNLPTGRSQHLECGGTEWFANFLVQVRSGSGCLIAGVLMISGIAPICGILSLRLVNENF